MTSGWRSTGFPDADSRDDFSRARRRAQWSRVAARLMGRPGELDVLLPYDEVVAALGRRGEHKLGEQLVDLDSIVGSVDRRTGFDRHFRPTSDVARRRFERIAALLRRGRELPPVDLYRVGDVHFVRDGHHRVAVARALGWPSIRALVTEVLTALPAGASLTVDQLPLKSHERLFYERVPLPPEARDQIRLRDPRRYAVLAEGVEAWGFRICQERGTLLARADIARLWWTDEYQHALRLLRENDLLDPAHTETESYLDLTEQRYQLLRSQVWDERSLRSLRQARSGGRRRLRRRRPRPT